jgi:glycosyltransferase involved in cell wall biosynthesis
MRIALLAHAPVRGGSTDLFLQARDAFLQRGHEVQCIFGMGAEQPDPRTAGAWIIPRVVGSWRELLREYIRQVESFRPDLVYAISGRVEADLFRFLRCARVRHVSSLEEHEYFNVPLVLEKCRPYLEACTANTPDALEQVAKITGKPTYLLPYLFPEPLNQIAHVDGAKLLDAKNPIEIAFVSRFERFQKRTHWLPEIIHACEKAGANLAWHLYGDGPDLASVQSRVADNPRVTFHGWISRETLYERLPLHDILFFCSRWEGLPIAMVEGMRCGLACVSTDIPAGIRWTLEQGGGWLYDAKSAGDASAALLNAVKDRALILEKRREALHLARKLFNVGTAAEQYRQLDEAFAKLRFNGEALDLDRAAKFRAISVPTYIKRLVIKPQR